MNWEGVLKQDLNLFEIREGILSAISLLDTGEWATPHLPEERRKEGVDILYKISQQLQTQMQKQRGN